MNREMDETNYDAIAEALGWSDAQQVKGGLNMIYQDRYKRNEWLLKETQVLMDITDGKLCIKRDRGEHWWLIYTDDHVFYQVYGLEDKIYLDGPDAEWIANFLCE